MFLQNKIIAIVGPTASGKTSLSLDLAKRIGGEILICDAYQLRAGLSILTAKPTLEEQEQVPHHLLGALPLSQVGTAAVFVKLADPVIAKLKQEGKPVIICGGTGLYLKALVEGLFEGPAASPEVRENLRKEQKEIGTPALHQRLVEVDPQAASRIMPNDYVRIERALEVYLLTGKPISVWQQEGKKKGPRYQVSYLGLDPGQETLREKIKLRIEQMISKGVCEEVGLAQKQYGVIPSPPLGFDLIDAFLQGQLTLELMKQKLAEQTSQYAKRQRNWFRSIVEVTWYPNSTACLNNVSATTSSYLSI